MEVMVRHGSSRGYGRWLIAVVVVAGLGAFGAYKGLTVGSKALATAAEETGPVTLEPLGDSINRILLSARAAERIGIETAPVRDQLVGKRQRIVVPYSALIYGPDGQAWTYTTKSPLTFVRQRVTVDSINGDLAIVSKGPGVGSRVVTVGAEELFGSEIEFQE